MLASFLVVWECYIPKEKKRHNMCNIKFENKDKKVLKVRTLRTIIYFYNHF